MRLQSLGSNVAASGNQTAVSMVSHPGLGNRSGAILHIEPNDDFAGVVVIQGSDDGGSTYSAIKTVTYAGKRESLNKGGLAISATPAAVKSTAAVQYSIFGKLYSLAAFTTQALSGTGMTTGDYAKFLLSADVSGTVTVTQGTVGASSAAAVLPATPAGEAPIGYVEVAATGAAFTPGTTSLSATGIVDTYVDLRSNPADVAPDSRSVITLKALTRLRVSGYNAGKVSADLITGI